MASDFAVYYLTEPLGLFVQLLLLIVPAALLRLAAPSAFARLGFLRIGLGHIAVAVVTYILSAWSAYEIGVSKVELGHIQGSEIFRWVVGNSLYLFVLSYLFALTFASLVLLPFCVWLARTDRASLAALLALGAILAVGLAVLTVAFPSNEWGRKHPLALFMSTLSSLGVGTLVIALAFGFGARLPIRAGLRHAT